MTINLEHTDRLLTTTRSVRKRLDFERDIDTDTVMQCIDLALQAPTGSNSQGWSFMMVRDAKKREAIADYYRQSFNLYANDPERRATYDDSDMRSAQMPRVVDSAVYLAENMHRAPLLVIGCIEGRAENEGVMAQAGMYGSILPAAWSFMLALRARGMGTAWTTLHLMYEQEVAALLGIPDEVTQAVLFPVAYFTGEDFKPAKRLPAAELVHWDAWGQRA